MVKKFLWGYEINEEKSQTNDSNSLTSLQQQLKQLASQIQDMNKKESLLNATVTNLDKKISNVNDALRDTIGEIGVAVTSLELNQNDILRKLAGIDLTDMKKKINELIVKIEDKTELTKINERLFDIETTAFNLKNDIRDNIQSLRDGIQSVANLNTNTLQPSMADQSLIDRIQAFETSLTKLSALEVQLTTINESITTIQDSIETLKNSPVVVEDSGLTDRVLALETDNANLQSQFDTLETKFSNLETVIEDIRNCCETVKNKIVLSNKLAIENALLREYLATFETNVNNLKTEVETIKTSSLANTADITSLKATPAVDTTSLNTKLNELQTEASSLRSDLETLYATKQDLDNIQLPQSTGDVDNTQLESIHSTIDTLATKSELNIYALKDDIEDFITSDDLPDLSNYVQTDDLPDLSNYVEKEEIENFITSNDLPDLSNYVQTDDLPDLSNYVQTDALSNYVQTNGLSNYVQTDALSNYVQTNDLSNYVQTDAISNFITSDDLPDLSNYVQTDALSNYITTSVLNNKLQALNNIPQTVTNFKTEMTTLCDDNKDLLLAEFLNLQRQFRNKKETVVINLQAKAGIVDQDIPILLEHENPYYRFKIAGRVTRIAITSQFRHSYSLVVGNGELNEHQHLRNVQHTEELFIARYGNKQVDFQVTENTKMQLRWIIIQDQGQRAIEIPENKTLSIEIYLEKNI